MTSRSAAQGGPHCLQNQPDRWACQADFFWQGEHPDNDFGHFGHSVAGWGDFDADGFADMVIGGTHQKIEETCPVAQFDSHYSSVWIGFGPFLCNSHPTAQFCQESYSSLVQIRNTSHFGDCLGWEVCFPGDIDGDGFDEIAIGAPLSNTAGINAGTVYVLFMRDPGALDAAGTGPFDPEGAGGIPGVATVVIRGQVARDWFGWAIAGPGNVYGSSHKDLLVGAPSTGLNPPLSNTGKAYAIDGEALSAAAPATGGQSAVMVLSAGNHVVRAGTSTYGRYGYAVSGVGDLDLDGRNDIAVGAIQARYVCIEGSGNWVSDPGDAGRVEVFGLTQSGSVGYARSVSGDGTGDMFGLSISGFGAGPGVPGGDITGDGVPDILIGAPFHDPAQLPDAGKAVIVSGQALLAQVPAVWAQFLGDVQGESFGWRVVGGGYVGYDAAFPDFAITSRRYSTGTIPPCALSVRGSLVGRVQVYCGLALERVVQYTGEQIRSRLGFDLSWMPDLQGNGKTELLISASAWSPCAPDPTQCPTTGDELGRAYVQRLVALRAGSDAVSHDG